jgi:putative hydrolase of the HAD superfamily
MPRGRASNPIKAFLFDAGHTLIEPHEAALAEAAVAAYLTVGASEVTRAFRKAISALNRQPGSSPSTFRDLVALELMKLGLQGETVEEAFWTVLDRHNAERSLWTKPIAGAGETLAALKSQGIKVGVVSNSDGFVAQYLDRAGLLGYCDVVVDSQIVGVEKPDPRIFEHALEQLGVAPAGVTFVGDRYDVDVMGAEAVGMRGVLFDPEGDPIEGVHMIRTLPEILALI